MLYYIEIDLILHVRRFLLQYKLHAQRFVPFPLFDYGYLYTYTMKMKMRKPCIRLVVVGFYIEIRNCTIVIKY